MTGDARGERADRDQDRSREARWRVAEAGAANEEEDLSQAARESDEQPRMDEEQDLADPGVTEASRSGWVVLVDGVRSSFEIPDDELPRPGTVLAVGGERARVDYIAPSEDGRPLISATRIGSTSD